MEKSKTKSILIIFGLALIVVIILFAVGMNLQKPGDSNSDVLIDETAPMNGDDSPEMLIDIPEVLQESVVLIEGTNPVSKDGLVLTETGETAKNDVEPMSEGAPRQTTAISKNELPSSAINLEVSLANGWSPKEFKVSAGEVVVLSVTPSDDRVYIFAFQDPSLSAVAVGVSPGETRAITFNAPSEPGEYAFYSNSPNYQIMGLEGMMIVE